MASNKREMYAERKGRCEGGEKVGGGVFFRKQPRKDKRDGRGGGEVVEGTQKKFY